MKTHANAPLNRFIRERRLALGLSQKHIANKLGYSSAQFISNWERGLSRPPVTALRKVALILNIEADEIFNIFLSDEIKEITIDLRNKFFK